MITSKRDITVKQNWVVQFACEISKKNCVESIYAGREDLNCIKLSLIRIEIDWHENWKEPQIVLGEKVYLIQDRFRFQSKRENMSDRWTDCASPFTYLHSCCHQQDGPSLLPIITADWWEAASYGIYTHTRHATLKKELTSRIVSFTRPVKLDSSAILLHGERACSWQEHY